MGTKRDNYLYCMCFFSGSRYIYEPLTNCKTVRLVAVYFFCGYGCLLYVLFSVVKSASLVSFSVEELISVLPSGGTTLARCKHILQCNKISATVHTIQYVLELFFTVLTWMCFIQWITNCYFQLGSYLRCSWLCTKNLIPDTPFRNSKAHGVGQHYPSPVCTRESTALCASVQACTPLFPLR